MLAFVDKHFGWAYLPRNLLAGGVYTDISISLKRKIKKAYNFLLDLSICIISSFATCSTQPADVATFIISLKCKKTVKLICFYDFNKKPLNQLGEFKSDQIYFVK